MSPEPSPAACEGAAASQCGTEDHPGLGMSQEHPCSAFPALGMGGELPCPLPTVQTRRCSASPLSASPTLRVGFEDLLSLFPSVTEVPWP